MTCVRMNRDWMFASSGHIFSKNFPTIDRRRSAVTPRHASRRSSSIVQIRIWISRQNCLIVALFGVFETAAVTVYRTPRTTRTDLNRLRHGFLVDVVPTDGVSPFLISGRIKSGIRSAWKRLGRSDFFNLVQDSGINLVEVGSRSRCARMTKVWRLWRRLRRNWMRRRLD